MPYCRGLFSPALLWFCQPGIVFETQHLACKSLGCKREVGDWKEKSKMTELLLKNWDKETETHVHYGNPVIHSESVH